MIKGEIKLGSSIYAKRKIKSNIYHNRVVGPVTSIFSNGIRVTCNDNFECEIFFSDWDVTVLTIRGVDIKDIPVDENSKFANSLGLTNPI